MCVFVWGDHSSHRLHDVHLIHFLRFDRRILDRTTDTHHTQEREETQGTDGENKRHQVMLRVMAGAGTDFHLFFCVNNLSGKSYSS